MRIYRLALPVLALIAAQSTQAAACMERYEKPTVGSADSAPNRLCDELAASGLVAGYDAWSFLH